MMKDAAIGYEELLQIESAKVDLSLQALEELVLQPMRCPRLSQKIAKETVSLLINIIEEQKRQMTQTSELIKTLVDALNRAPTMQRLVEPDIFEESAQSPQQWIFLYEYASRKNMWLSDDDEIQNLRRYLDITAKKWYDLQIFDKLFDILLGAMESKFFLLHVKLVLRKDGMLC